MRGLLDPRSARWQRGFNSAAPRAIMSVTRADPEPSASHDEVGMMRHSHWAAVLAAFALVLFATAQLASPAYAESEDSDSTAVVLSGDEHVPTESHEDLNWDSPYDFLDPGGWESRALDYFVAAGILEGYDKAYFGSSHAHSRYEYTVATARLLDVIGTSTQDQELHALSEALQFEFSDQLVLMLEAVNALGGNVHGYPDTPISHDYLYELAKLHESSDEEAYDEVPRIHWSYNALDRLAEKGTLGGYPKDFFNGDRTLTRFEFAQAIARLLDTHPDFSPHSRSASWSSEHILVEALRDEFVYALAQL